MPFLLIQLYQFHPLSISNYPSPTDDPAAPTRLTFHILASGRSDSSSDSGSWTRRLHSELQSGGKRLRVHVDGPYGRLQVDLRRYGIVMLAAGGIGQCASEKRRDTNGRIAAAADRGAPG